MIVKYIKDSSSKVFLNFTFDNRTGGYWTLRSVKYVLNRTVLLTTRPEISVPHGRSYHSSGPVVFKNGDVVLMFSDLQVRKQVVSQSVCVYNNNEFCLSGKDIGVLETERIISFNFCLLY